jgi:tRNA(fMet)-specific endonuclease VapC
MLDTNVCIDAIRNRSRLLVERIRSRSVDDIAISVITLSELQHGIAKSSYPEKNRVAMLEFLVPFAVLPFDDMAARSYGQIRATLEAQGNAIGPMDMLIAAHALSRRVSLVTNNVDEFRRVPGLSVENWIAP